MLTEKETQMLGAIKTYIEENGYSPTVRELGEIVGLKSSSTVHNHLKKLETKGYISKMGNFPRTMKVLKTLKKANS